MDYNSINSLSAKLQTAITISRSGTMREESLINNDTEQFNSNQMQRSSKDRSMIGNLILSRLSSIP